jgi:hypothetical protein
VAPPDWFIGWIERHRTAFGLSADTWNDTMLDWYESVLRPLGCTEAELNEASARCMRMSPVPRFPADHLDAIKQHVADQRSEGRLPPSARYLPGASAYCKTCDDTGMVSVPHPDDLDRIEWVWLAHRREDDRRQVSVTCSCRRGQLCQDSLTRAGTGIGLGEHLARAKYEAFNPKWRRMLADWQARRRADLEERYADRTVFSDAVDGVIARAIRKKQSGQMPDS